MYLTILIDGITYKTKATDKLTAEKAIEILYENFADMDKMKADLEDGSYLLINKGGLDRAVLIFHP